MLIQRNAKPTARIFTHDFLLVDEIDEIESLVIVSNIRNIGRANVTVNKYARGVRKFVMGAYVYFPAEPDMLFRVMDKISRRGSSNMITIVCVSVETFLKQRVTVPPTNADGTWRTSHYNKSGPSDTVMKSLITDNITGSRSIPSLAVAAINGSGNSYQLSSRFQVISDELEKIAIATGMGWTIKPDIMGKRLLFDTILPTDRTSKTANSTILSVDNGTLTDIEYTESMIDFANVAWVGGQGEGIDRRIIRLEDTNEGPANITGIDMFEIFVDARDIGETKEGPNEGDPEIPLTPEEVIALLTQRGNTRLKEVPYIRSITAKADPYAHRQFGVHYFLGDYITIEDRDLEIMMDTQIIQSEKVFEEGQVQINLTFGEDKPTIIKKLQDSIKDSKASSTS